MPDSTAALARSITWAGSKQMYCTARLMVDRDLVDDSFRAYAYLRWADDVVDIASRSRNERVSFIKRQRELIYRLYNNEKLDNLTPEEGMVADLIRHDKEEKSGLHSFIHNFLAILEFDAYRKGRLITRDELEWYSGCLSRAVTDGIQYFIGHGHPYPADDNRYLGVVAAHIAHMLRDMMWDTAEGFINIPREYLEANDISPMDFDSEPFRIWVRDRVRLARQCLGEGKEYLDELEVLRCKVVGYWYSTRFEGVLDAIEREDFVLRERYTERRRMPTLLKIAGQGIFLPIRHLAGRGVGILRP